MQPTEKAFSLIDFAIRTSGTNQSNQFTNKKNKPTYTTTTKKANCSIEKN